MTLEMPATKASPSVAPTHNAAVPVPVEARPKLLIVDDRRENLLATERVLKSLDAEIFKATTGNQALSLMLRHKFAVLLLDVQMPEMDGFEVAMLMQDHETMRAVPIIFVTAISKEEKYATQAAKIGAVDYIFKPINPAILKSKVKVYLDIYVQREQILKLNATLLRSNEELERFAYICSHDLQEPVRMMNSYARMLTGDHAETLGEAGLRHLKLISENALRMHKMIQGILSFSRVGREEIEMETVASDEILREVLIEYDGKVRERSAEICVGALPVLKTSPTLLRVLLQNLIGNALKFQDGSRRPAVSIGAERAGAFWKFSVADNGIGIDPGLRHKIFAIFQRLHRNEIYPGTGIGLATCKKFVELCGGTIEFDSRPDEGTTFYFTLPAGDDVDAIAS